MPLGTPVERAAGVERVAGETGLPWRVAVQSRTPPPEQAAFARRRALLLAGLSLVGLLTLAAGFVLLRSIGRQTALSRLQSEFVAAVSHEFRTPLTSLRQFTEQLLKKRRVDYRVAHVASGVAGLQSALAAGLGVACLNESALAEGVELLAPPHGLPTLPRVDFQLLPPRRGEPELVGRVRELLAQQLR